MSANTIAEQADPRVRRLADWNPTVLEAVAEEHSTPLYVLDLDRIRENYSRMSMTFSDAKILYAAKANTLGLVLSALADAGAGVECASAGEVIRAVNAGFSGSNLHYTAVNPPDEDLDEVVGFTERGLNLTIIAGAQDTIDRLYERDFCGRLCIRIDPGIGAGHHAHVTTGDDPKFGVPYDRALDVLTSAKNRGFDIVGIHAHAGSGISSNDLNIHREMTRRIGDLARRSSIDFEFVDVGGGFGVPYRPEEPPLDLDAVAEATYDALGAVNCTLVIEPGRYLVADAGVLLTEVNTVKPVEGTIIAGVDAGMNTLLRPALYGAYHHILNLAQEADNRPEKNVTVAGPICESGDTLAKDRALPVPRRGDLLAIGNAGAYGFEMASHYNSRPRPAIIAIKDGKTTIARRRETIKDIYELEQ